ncbi:MAG: hypothetical protein AAF329_01060 [Cyanobacteria bacterium P01_A01_bin.17]
MAKLSETEVNELFNTLQAELEDIVPFAPNPTWTGQNCRVATTNGFGSLEVLADGKATLFVQTSGMGPVEIAQHASMLLKFLEFFFPSWARAQEWLDKQLLSSVSEVKFSRERKLVTLRKSRLGVFLTIE